MNVGIAVHRYAVNEGTGGYVVQLLPRIAELHRVTLYTAQVSTPVPIGVEVVHVPALMTRAYTAILTFPIGLRAVRRHHDVFHVQGWLSSSAEVVTAHIVMAAWRRAARRARVRTPLGERTLGPWVQSREAALIRGAARVIAPSAKVREEIAQCYGRSMGVTVVNHGFPNVTGRSTRITARQALALPRTATVALFVGDLRKGFDVALEAVKQTPGVHLAVASHSSAGPALKRAATTDMRQRLHWLGPLEDTSLAYTASDFLLHPTIYDSFGLVVAEAMAHGLPVVVTREAGIAELIHHGETGWIVEGNTLTGTRAATSALASDPALRERLGTRAHAVAANRTWDIVARETLAVYEEAAQR